MPEIDETIHDAVERASASRLNSVVAVLVAVSATFMALCNIKDGNIVQGMEQAQARTIDQWGYFQAKGMKLNLAEQMVDEFELARVASPALTPGAEKLLDSKLADYRARVKLYETEKAQIRKDAEDSTQEYDRLNFHDDQFDAAESCLSIAIALFGVTSLTQKRWLLGFGVGIAVLGFTLGISGFLGWNLHPNFLARILG
jgi:Domain of unknown function (DUF4337)